MIKEKAEKLIEAIRHNMSPESIVCDSVVRCQGWDRATFWDKYYPEKRKVWINIKDTFEFCPWCSKRLIKKK